MNRATASIGLCLCLLGPWLPAAAQEAAPATTAPTQPASSGPLAEPWTSTPLEGARSIAAGDGRFVVVGGRRDPVPSAVSWTSTDGLTWAGSLPSAALEGAIMNQVVSTPDGFVALGTTTRGRAARPGDRLVAWTSADGLTRQRSRVEGGRTRTRGFDAYAQDLEAGPGGLLAVGSFRGQDFGPTRMWRSTDGRAWERVRLPAIDLVNDIAATADGFLLSGYTFEPSSTPGPGDPEGTWPLFSAGADLSWQPVEGKPGPLLALAVSNDGTLVGGGGTRIHATSDLASWETSWEDPNPAHAEDGLTLDGPWWDGAQFVATGPVVYGYQPCPDGEGACPLEPILVSRDGRTWVESAGPDGIPGPDRDVYVTDSASLDGTTVVLGWMGRDDQVVAWLVPGGLLPAGA
jgi:hypothetical protein